MSNQQPKHNGINNNTTQNRTSDSSSRDPSIYYGQQGHQKRRSSKSQRFSLASEDLSRGSHYLQKSNDGEKIFQESLVYDRRSDSVNHQQSLNQFINSKQNSEVRTTNNNPDEQFNSKKSQYVTPQNQQSYYGSKSQYKLNQMGYGFGHDSHISRGMSQVIPPPTQSKHKQKSQNNQMTDQIATLQEDREPNASFLSDENGRIINEIQYSHDKFFQKSGLKGIIYLVSESSHSAIAMLPYFFSQFGILLSIILILTLITVSNYSFFYLLKAKNLSRRSNYHTIAMYLSGTSGYRFIFIIQFLTKFSNCTVLMYFAARQMQEFVLNVKGIEDDDNVQFIYSYQFYLIMIATCMVTLSLFVVVIRQTTFTQIVNVTFLLSMIILTLISFITTLNTKELKGDYVFLPDDFKFGYAFSSMSVLLFLLDIHMNFFNVYKFMRKPSDKKMLRTSLYANMILGLCFIFIGAFGYISTTGLDRNVNYLISFSQLNLHITFSSVALVIYVLYCLINFPLQFSIARSHVLKIFNTFKIDKQSTLEFPLDVEREPNEQLPFFKSSSQDPNQANPNYQYNQYSNLPHFHSNQSNDTHGQHFPNETIKHFEESNVHHTLIYVRQIRFYATTIAIFIVMFIINFFLDDPILEVLFAGVFFASVNAFIIPIAFYIKLSNYESTFVVIISVLMLFTILGLDFITLLGQVFTLIE